MKLLSDSSKWCELEHKKITFENADIKNFCVSKIKMKTEMLYDLFTKYWLKLPKRYT